MKLLFADNHARGGQARKERIAVGVGVVAALLVALSPGSMMPKAEAAFPGRNGRIVFEAAGAEALRPPGPAYIISDFDLFSVGSRGEGLRELTQGPESDNYPAWSPDGTRIAFTRAPNYQAAGDICVMTAEGGALVNLTESPLQDDRVPSWSPDGTRIVFSSGPIEGIGRSSDLYTVNADGSDLKQLTATEEQAEAFPTWSPDGRWIVYSGEAGLALIDAESGRPRTLVSAAALNGRTPFDANWSPDGKTLVFLVAAPDAVGALAAPDIWIVNATGSGLHQVTQSADIMGVSWSPDGHKLVASRHVEGRVFRLFTMNPDGSNLRQVLSIDVRAPAAPDWGPRP